MPRSPKKNNAANAGPSTRTRPATRRKKSAKTPARRESAIVGNNFSKQNSLSESQGDLRGSQNSNEAHGPEASAVLPHLCDGLTFPPRRQGDRGDRLLRPDGPREEGPREAQ